MGNYASKDDSYKKAESDIRYPLQELVYKKTEADSKFQKTGNYALVNDTYNKQYIDTITGADIDSKFYSKFDSDARYITKTDASNNVSTNSLKLGEYYMTNLNSKICIGKNNEPKMYCFDGKIVSENEIN
jgi:hypothetical protein